MFSRSEMRQVLDIDAGKEGVITKRLLFSFQADRPSLPFILPTYFTGRNNFSNGQLPFRYKYNKVSQTTYTRS
jgi:hypothetical protein